MAFAKCVIFKFGLTMTNNDIVQKLWNLCDHYQPVLDNSSSDRVPGVEAPENFQEPEIWKNKNRQKEGYRGISG